MDIVDKVVELDGKELITMSNDLARACYSLTKNEMRLLLVAMAQMPKSVKDKDGNYKSDDYDFDEIAKQPFYITKSDFVALGVDSKTVAREIRSACSELMGKKLTVDSPFGEREINWTDSVLHFKSEKFEELKRRFPNSKYDDDFIQYLRLHNLLDSLNFVTKHDDNIVARVVFTRSIIPYICQLKEKFVEINLVDFQGFHSFYSYRIYMLMMTFRSTGRIYIRLIDFRKMLDLTDHYKSIKDFKKHVLDIAIDEISAKSPFTASYELTDKSGRTSGRGIKATNLIIRFNEKKKAIDSTSKPVLPTAPTPIPNVSSLVETVPEVATVDESYLNFTVAKCNEYFAQKNITDEKRKENYIKKAMREGWYENEYKVQENLAREMSKTVETLPPTKQSVLSSVDDILSDLL
jgi:plasmid replication initiation protein